MNLFQHDLFQKFCRYVLQLWRILKNFFDRYIYVSTDSIYSKKVVTSIFGVFAFFLCINILLYFNFYGDYSKPIPFPYQNNFDDQKVHRLKHRGGKWTLKDGGLIQNKTDGTDLLAVVPLKIMPYKNYYLQTHFQILKGPSGAGVLFNMQDFNSRKESHIIRFGKDKDRTYLVYGYFDKDLKFSSQGGVTIEKPIKVSSIGVLVEGDFYTVISDSKILKKDIPLKYFGGYSSLTTWFSSVKFNDISIGHTKSAKKKSI